MLKESLYHISTKRTRSIREVYQLTLQIEWETQLTTNMGKTSLWTYQLETQNRIFSSRNLKEIIFGKKIKEESPLILKTIFRPVLLIEVKERDIPCSNRIQLAIGIQTRIEKDNFTQYRSLQENHSLIL